jgi:hypothetical protein
VALCRAQITSSAGFVVYRWLLGNWVFLVTNALMLCKALLGQWIYASNRQSWRDPRGFVDDEAGRRYGRKGFYDHQCDGPAGLSPVFVNLSRFRDRAPN